MVRTTYLLVEEWPAVRLALAAGLAWLGFRLLYAASRVEPHHPGCVFLNGRVPTIADPVLRSFGKTGERLAKRL